jgi:L-fuconate dehydratase
MGSKIVDLTTMDIRFPTSRLLDGSDAMNEEPDYSAAYVVLETDQPGLTGHGMTFTTGRGNELCVAAIHALSPRLVGRDLASITADLGAFWASLVDDGQLRWVGPEKGVIHLATAAIVNAVWDLYAKSEGKPLWRLLADMSPEEVVRCIPFRYITDALTPDQATAILEAGMIGREARMEQTMEHDYPAYTTSVGWMGYDDEKILDLCRPRWVRLVSPASVATKSWLTTIG